MKLFVVSDVHSFFTPFKQALDEVGFESGNDGHLLVVCGDLFDRGDESCELFEYINSVPNKILVLGNHEELLKDCIDRGYPQMHDLSNGTSALRVESQVLNRQSSSLAHIPLLPLPNATVARLCFLHIADDLLTAKIGVECL